MIFKFVLISDEVDNFSREIWINSESTFFELHEAILKCVGYANDQIPSFFLCNDDWEKETEITLFEMDTDSDVDNWVMDKAILSELIPDEKQKLIYVFDTLNERVFFMELIEMIYNKDIATPKCTSSIGEPPAQFLEDNFLQDITAQLKIGENFYGEDSFNPDEFDEEGFDDFVTEGEDFSDSF
ncbi:MAG: plasmid pRiA4b ORF-3 family protein [Candidatus Azobacteroides sp.]|nr:plasmid pRiA4b ORF-3 family protein [Candidatus Azobacteroides sp.]